MAIDEELPPIADAPDSPSPEDAQDTVQERPAQPPERLQVIFDHGIPAWIGPEPIEGSELIEGLSLDFLVAHMRTAEGAWVPRPPPPPPTEEELAELARVVAENQARAEADWRRWMEQEIARRTQPDMLQYLMGNISQAELRAREAIIRADVEAGN